MSTETLGGTRPVVVRPQHETEHLPISFINDSGADLKEGMEVILKTDGTLDKRDAGTEYPIGIVEKGGADGERVTVGTAFQTTVNAVASGNLNAGVFVKPTGVVTAAGRPTYIVVADGDYASAIVLAGANDTLPILIGILRTPIRTTDVYVP